MQLNPLLLITIILLSMLGGIGVNYLLVLGGVLAPLVAG